MDCPRSMSFKFQGRMVTSSFMKYIFTSYICQVGSFNPFFIFCPFHSSLFELGYMYKIYQAELWSPFPNF